MGTAERRLEIMFTAKTFLQFLHFMIISAFSELLSDNFDIVIVLFESQALLLHIGQGYSFII